MIVYNTTIKINAAIIDDWLTWLKEEHIPAILKTGCFTSAQILRLLETEDEEGPTYAIQYYAENTASYNRYIKNFSGVMLQKSFNKWGNQFISFNSVMEVVN